MLKIKSALILRYLYDNKKSNATKGNHKKRAKELNIIPQAALQAYCLERLLERISLSDKAECFIIKGGFLISAFIGIENRSTKDIDTTIKGFDVTKENVSEIFKSICQIHVEDQLNFEFDRVEEIRETDDYPGIRVFLHANYSVMKTSLTVDVTTGDSIIPAEIRYSYRCIYDDKTINIMAYPLENVLAEKLETIISRGIANTRPRDFYDIYILYKLKSDQIDWKTLKKALLATSIKCGTEKIMAGYRNILETLKTDGTQLNYWNKYASKTPFAKGITYLQTLDMIELCFNKIGDL